MPRLQSAMEHRKPFGKRFHPKLQSAMEYLMTYGWAILVIAVVLGVLYSLGIFSPSNFAPKAQPGSCQVFRPNGPGTSYDINLEGTCSGELPQYVGYFNGQSSTINLGHSSLLSPINAQTITAWVEYQPSACSTSTSCIVVGLTGFHNFIAVGNSRVDTYWTTSNVPAGYNYAVTVSGVSSSIFGFMAMTYNSSSGNAALYFDGVQVGSYNFGGTITVPGTNLVSISGREGGTDLLFNGLISNVQIYNTSLTANEINSIYNEGIGGAPVSLQNLVAWYPLNGNANDYSGNNNNGVPSNVIFTATWQSEYTLP